ncbi:MAG: T9SS type A sorting domain-containing protein, partial [Bacteroidota bacterium]|nr:T9SS type A sorting domain-containing protein [Bacteroidota bacterium]
IYEKDQSVNNGSDCAYLDLVRFPAHSFVPSAINLNKLSSPEKGQTYDEEVIAVELTNLGRDTINLLSMTYVVNDNSPVNETFNTDLKPGDTTNLSFSQTVDMSLEDTYNIMVYLTYPENYFIDDTLKTTIVSTGINDTDLNKNAFTLAPNPVKDRIRLICHRNSEDNSFILYNSSGMMVYRKEIDYISAGEQVFLDPEHLSRGSYILIIRNTEKRYLYKVIKL